MYDYTWTVNESGVCNVQVNVTPEERRRWEEIDALWEVIEENEEEEAQD